MLTVTCAEMVELVDTQASGACGGNSVEVQVLFSAEQSLKSPIDYLRNTLPLAKWQTYSLSNTNQLKVNISRNTITSSRAGPVVIKSMGILAKASIRNKYCCALAGKAAKFFTPRVDCDQPGSVS